MEREKVIKEFADYVQYFKAYCIGDIEDHAMLKDVLALLKEQKEEIENLKQTAQSMMEGICLLKEQEAVKPYISKKYGIAVCDKCKAILTITRQPFCHSCGVRLKWE